MNAREVREMVREVLTTDPELVDKLARLVVDRLEQQADRPADPGDQPDENGVNKT